MRNIKEGDFVEILSNKYDFMGVGRVVHIWPEFSGKMEYHIDIMMGMASKDNPLYLVSIAGRDPNKLYGFNSEEVTLFENGLKQMIKKVKRRV